MPVCARCGRESPEEFGFCPGCGAALSVAAPREVRKVVTVLFCDLTGSTALGHSTDPEALRARMTRYYDGARAVLERHGGTVEKFVGDAVMAVFGIPVATEDDALRAARAAVELRETVHALGLEARIGVNTGEVVAGDGDTLVTGDAVNVAARLEQAAGPGEVLLGGKTFRLVRDAVVADRVEVEAKGKPLPVVAYRLVSIDVSAAGVARRLDAPMVGRARERQRLRTDFEDVVETRSTRLFTLIGPAGVGKSRLVADFLDQLGERARVAQGRALSYGEGITYWPLVEVLIQLGLDPDEAIRSSHGDTQLASRALFEHVAAERPLVLVFDDLHWAEAPMLDLVEHVADWSRDAPILLLGIARPELLDLRPGWAGGKLNATSLLLEPLPSADAETLVGRLVGDLEPATRARILETAEGNPLFLEELAVLARETGTLETLPSTIQAVLQARIDRLSSGERAVIERGAVEGNVFHRGAVTALTPISEHDGIPAELLALIRMELLRPEHAQIPGDDAYRFRHLLIRDTAYEALPKATRAELHQRFADWLDTRATLVEQDEIVGYHLEQAARYHAELDHDDAAGQALATRAAHRLGAAGRAAFAREDHHATRNLLTRAIALLPEGAERRRLIPDLVDAKLLGHELSGIEDLLLELDRGDERDRATAVALRGVPTAVTTGHVSFAELAGEARAARETLVALGDDMGVVRCDRTLAHLAWGACRAGDTLDAALRAHRRLRAMGSTAFQRELVGPIQLGLVFSGRTVAETRAVFEELFGAVSGAGPLFEAAIRAARAKLSFGAGDADAEEVRVAVDQEVTLLRQTGAALERVFASNFLPRLAWLEGDDGEAEALLRARVAELEALGATTWLANSLAEWAEFLCRTGHPDAALAAVARARAVALDDDLADQIVIASAEGHAWALKGEPEQARGHLGHAASLLADIDMVYVVNDMRYTDALARAALGDLPAARSMLEQLADDSERRGFRREAARYRRDLAGLDA